MKTSCKHSVKKKKKPVDTALSQSTSKLDLRLQNTEYSLNTWNFKCPSFFSILILVYDFTDIMRPKNEVVLRLQI